MMNLLIYESRRIIKSGLPWCLLAVMLGLILFAQADFPQRSPLRAQLSAQIGITPVYPLLSDRFFIAPAHEEELKETIALLEQARERNQENRIISGAVQSGDHAVFAYSLFLITQNGLLILGSFVLALAGSDFFMGPSLRLAGSFPLVLAKVLAISLTAALIFLLPKAVVLWAGGAGETLNLVLPFNPRAGFPLYTSLDSAQISGYAGWRSIEAASLMTLRQAFSYLFAYEGLQILLWVSLGLLFGILIRRRYFALAAAALFVLGQKSLDLSAVPFTDFLFLSYDDAVRDVLGSPLMVRGITEGLAPRDYALGLSVMFITSLAALWLADLACRRRFFQISRKGDEDAEA